MNPYVIAGYSAVLVTLAVYSAWLVFKAAKLRRATQGSRANGVTPRA
ncbi:MAG: hypothetical protein M0Z92_11040 [Actinomycetota bacterium]|nr:hypothetical protein [Actinomycetota bacterium]